MDEAVAVDSFEDIRFVVFRVIVFARFITLDFTEFPIGKPVEIITWSHLSLHYPMIQETTLETQALLVSISAATGYSDAFEVILLLCNCDNHGVFFGICFNCSTVLATSSSDTLPLKYELQ